MKLLTVKEVAGMLNVSEKLVYRMAKQGRIVPTPGGDVACTV